MDLTELKRLVEFLQLAGVQYYKDKNVELILSAQVTSQAVLPSLVATADSGGSSEPLPKVYSKLPKNYSHPSLFRKAE